MVLASLEPVKLWCNGQWRSMHACGANGANVVPADCKLETRYTNFDARGDDVRSRPASVYKAGSDGAYARPASYCGMGCELVQEKCPQQASGEPNIHSLLRRADRHATPHGVVLLQDANDGCADGANHCPRPRPRHTGRMRTDADDVQTNCSPPVRQGTQHPTSPAARKPVRLPRPKQASRSAIVLSFRTTRACFGRFGGLVYRQRHPPAQEWRRHACCAQLPRLGNPRAHRLPVPRVHSTLALGRSEGAGTGHALHPCHWADLAPNRPVVQS